MKNFLFISGESTVSLPLVYSTREWNHTSNSGQIIFNKTLHRKTYPREDLQGIMFYSDYDDKELQRSNLEAIIASKVPCWPNPAILLRMFDRHKVMKECIDAGFVRHKVDQAVNFTTSLPFPVVVKTGNTHRGQDKFLVNNCKDIPEWSGIATIEPYFKGKSIRILVLGEDYSAFEVTNDKSWIKNSAGADIIDHVPSKELVEHAIGLTRFFGLDIAGVDYIVSDNGFHFLEINQFPGLGVTDKADRLSRVILASLMNEIVKNAAASIRG